MTKRPPLKSPRKRKNKTNRDELKKSNGRARAFLFAEGWDWLWFKSHVDFRRCDYYYLANDPKAHGCIDPFNLFDACGYDHEGRFWWIQIKTNEWPSEAPLKGFMLGKRDVRILAINVKTDPDDPKKYDIAVRELPR